MPLYRDEGIVVRTHRLGEADRIVVLLTRGRGKVRAVAKGVRKTSSRFGARLEPPTHLAVQCYEGRELDTVTQVETLDHFRALRDDLDLLTAAVTMLEVVDQVAPDREPDPGLFTLLLGALRTLAARPAPLVVPGFLLKLLAAQGVRPVTDACVECGATDDLVSFDAEAGGVHCRRHRRGAAVSGEALEVVRAILGGRLGEALARPPSEATAEVDRLATRAVEVHLERRLRSVSVLDR